MMVLVLFIDSALEVAMGLAKRLGLQSALAWSKLAHRVLSMRSFACMPPCCPNVARYDPSPTKTRATPGLPGGLRNKILSFEFENLPINFHTYKVKKLIKLCS